ncbi:hypothetical protein [Mariniblastus fucicola]|uniref:Uncharacterized protein n=1 Tax=Mariniblastus fucicola TaxID=980251 RepID=A0A5B9PF99_9BACT|nr:hypothetical protein [Mariniblastus fucicola]QEG24219.1 hypothetical protein MFFC18_41360 [Mariniblastus fucicola]
MESEHNPYASPTSAEPTFIAAHVGETRDLPAMPQLPLVFRTSPSALAIMVPCGVVLTAITAMLIGAPFQIAGLVSTSYDPIAALAFAVFTGVTAFGCLMGVRCKVVVNESAIEKTEFARQVIFFSRIKSWPQHPATGTVQLSLFDADGYLPVSNWAMEKEKSDLLAIVLRHRVGPASG